MRSTVKRNGKATKRPLTGKALERAVATLEAALKAHPKDLKVPISLRLDSDIYLELYKYADRGCGGGRYQTYLVQILRHHLFGEAIPAPVHTKKKRAG